MHFQYFIIKQRTQKEHNPKMQPCHRVSHTQTCLVLILQAKLTHKHHAIPWRKVKYRYICSVIRKKVLNPFEGCSVRRRRRQRLKLLTRFAYVCIHRGCLHTLHRVGGGQLNITQRQTPLRVVAFRVFRVLRVLAACTPPTSMQLCSLHWGSNFIQRRVFQDMLSLLSRADAFGWFCDRTIHALTIHWV